MPMQGKCRVKAKWGLDIWNLCVLLARVRVPSPNADSGVSSQVDKKESLRISPKPLDIPSA